MAYEVDLYQLSSDISDLYLETDPVTRPIWFDVEQFVYEDLAGIARAPWKGFATQVLSWVEENMEECDELKSVQERFRKLGR